MLIIPAIDLKDGHCVRLKQGVMEEATVFSEDPGCDGAALAGAGRAPPASGGPERRVCRQAEERSCGHRHRRGGGRHDIPVQLGGGIRDLETIERYLDNGVSYVIIGTAAVKKPGFLHEACDAFPGHIMVGLDAKDGKVAVDGWSKMTGHDVIDLAKKFEGYGVEAIIYTDIGRDGMLSGVNIEATVELAQPLTVPVIASGGITNLDDVQALCAVRAGRHHRRHHRPRDLRGHAGFRRGAEAGRRAVESKA